MTDLGQHPWTDHYERHDGTMMSALSQEPVPQTTHHSSNDPDSPATRTPFPSPAVHGDTGPGPTGAASVDRPRTPQTAGDPGQLLYTPRQAAAALQVRESWLRRRAAERTVPCTFLGKHLRFSRADLDAIVAHAAQRATARPRNARRSVSPPSHPQRQDRRQV
jgi:excisionase family DNA binding protein